MSEKSLIILTHRFPVEAGEVFLVDELQFIADYFKEVIIYPNDAGGKDKSLHVLPANVLIGNYGTVTSVKKNDLLIALKALPVLLRELWNIKSKKNYFRLFKFHLSLLKQSYLKALSVTSSIKNAGNTIIYSYWCDDLALTGAFCKQLDPEFTFISRAHGFDVFEEQSDFGHIFFRKFQLSELNKLWVVSKAGQKHLSAAHPEYSGKIGQRYLGIRSDGKICFEETATIRIVTCSHIRSIKRLDLLVETLMLSGPEKIEWHIIGEGEDLEMLKKAAEKLPINVQPVFHGHLPVEEIHRLYGSLHFDFLVSLSSSEGLPVSMMEAISHGIPVVSTDVGGCREIVNETTGVLIPLHFRKQELLEILSNCKGRGFDSFYKRKAIMQFWKQEFNAEINYKEFAEEVINLSGKK